MEAPLFDLAPRVLAHLDAHLAFALLEFLARRETYAQNYLLKAQIACLARTNMADFEADKRRELGEKADENTEVQARRAKVIAQMGEWEKNEAVQKFAKLLASSAPSSEASESSGDAPAAASDSEADRLRAAGEFTRAGLSSSHGVTDSDISSLHDYARFQYDCGKYSEAHALLSAFIELSEDSEAKLSALWGRLASEILLQNWDRAVTSIEEVRDAIDDGWKRKVPALRQLQQRTWLIHWSLFVFFNHESGRNLIVDMLFNNDRYLNAIQNTSPHILRYIATAIATNRRRRSAAYALVRVLQHEAHAHSDPVTEFMVSLFVDFDFEVAHAKLAECKPVLLNDFFLTALSDEFQENGRVMIFDTYCRIHQKIDISMLATKLDLSSDEAERWIVDLIRNARFDAKIDATDNTVVMGGSYSNTYQKIIEKTKGIQFRSFNVANNITKLQRQKDKATEAASSPVVA
jgi:translation initiation factor 3 subunit E